MLHHDNGFIYQRIFFSNFKTNTTNVFYCNYPELVVKRSTKNIAWNLWKQEFQKRLDDSHFPHKCINEITNIFCFNVFINRLFDCKVPFFFPLKVL